MTIRSETIISVSEANQNFSRATRIADTHGEAVIFKNNKPKYALIDLDATPYFDLTEDERIEIAARRVLKKHHKAFEELAK